MQTKSWMEKQLNIYFMGLLFELTFASQWICNFVVFFFIKKPDQSKEQRSGNWNERKTMHERVEKLTINWNFEWFCLFFSSNNLSIWFIGMFHHMHFGLVEFNSGIIFFYDLKIKNLYKYFINIEYIYIVVVV